MLIYFVCFIMYFHYEHLGYNSGISETSGKSCSCNEENRSDQIPPQSADTRFLATVLMCNSFMQT